MDAPLPARPAPLHPARQEAHPDRPAPRRGAGAASAPPSRLRTGRVVLGGLALWAALVTAGAALGLFRALPTPLVPVPVVVGLGGLLLAYRLSRPFRSWVETADLRALTLFHAWRIPAGVAFLVLGAQGAVPPLFAMLAGWGDVLAGLLALGAPLWHGRSRSRRWYTAFHLFGMADFVVAVGTGFAYSVTGEPLMDAVKVLPLAVVVGFGVPVTGAFGLMTLDRLRRAGR